MIKAIPRMSGGRSISAEAGVEVLVFFCTLADLCYTVVDCCPQRYTSPQQRAANRFSQLFRITYG